MNIFHFELTANEKTKMKMDSPYTSKSDNLLANANVRMIHIIILCINVYILIQIRFAEQQIIRPRVQKSYVVPTDPLFGVQWNIVSVNLAIY